MTDSRYAIRNYQPADFNKFVRLNIEAEGLEPSGRSISPRGIAERLDRPNYSPEQNLFLVVRDNRIVGYMDVTPELTIGRIILDGWIHPEHRRKGLATKLLDYAVRRGKELGARVAQVNIAEDNAIASKALSRSGFKPVRRFFELKLDTVRVSGQDVEQAALGCCHLEAGEEDRLTGIQNRAFAGSWGYNPNTVEEIVYRTNLRNCSPEDVVLVYDGDDVIGYCWTGVTCEGEVIGEGEGRILMIGSDPDYRGKGVGKKVLLAGLAYLKNKGVGTVGLLVDSENKVACGLYRSIGFEVSRRNLWYEKPLD